MMAKFIGAPNLVDGALIYILMVSYTKHDTNLICSVKPETQPKLRLSLSQYYIGLVFIHMLLH